VRCFSAATGRYTVELPDGTVRAIKPEHLSIATGDDAQNADISLPLTSEVSASVEEFVQDSRPLGAVQRRSLKPGTRAKLVGLKAKSMNGKVVRIANYENATQRYVVKLPDGSLRKVEASKLQETDEAPLPRLSVCNAYKPNQKLKVVLKNETGASKVLSSVQFAACEDFEEPPFDKGTVSMMLDSTKVADVPFDLSAIGKSRGTELTVAQSAETGQHQPQARVHENLVELSDGDAFYLHLVNAHAGSRPAQLTVQRGPVAKVLPMDKSYRLERVEDMSLTLTDGHKTLRLAFQPQKSRTYCAIVTGTDESDGTKSAGLVLHKLGEWTSAEQLENQAA